MTGYLVEVHARFDDASSEHLRTVEQRLRSLDMVLPEPVPVFLTRDGEQDAVLQFAVEAKNEVQADATGRRLAGAAVVGEENGSSLADVGLVSARRLADDDPDDS